MFVAGSEQQVQPVAEAAPALRELLAVVEPPPEAQRLVQLDHGAMHAE